MKLVSRKGRKHHGMSGSISHSSWCSMRERCNNPNHPSYQRYGGRGISVCDRWDSFLLFLEDMGERPSKDHSIDRINPDGDYEPSNCRWADSKTQGNNRCNNRHIVVNGVVMSHKDAAQELGVSYGTLRKQSADSNFSLEKFLSRKRRGVVTYRHVTEARNLHLSGVSPKEIAVQIGLSKSKVDQIIHGKDSKWMPYDYETLRDCA